MKLRGKVWERQLTCRHVAEAGIQGWSLQADSRYRQRLSCALFLCFLLSFSSRILEELKHA